MCEEQGKSVKRGQEPLDSEVRDAILAHISKNYPSQDVFAEEVGIKRTTLGDILRGNNALRRNKDILTRYHERHLDSLSDSGDLNSPPVDTVSSFSKQPPLSEKRQQVLLNMFGVGSKLVLSAAKELVGSKSSKDVRDVFREVFEEEILELYVAATALSTENGLEVARRGQSTKRGSFFKE
jgi:hypothetical protein